MSIRRWGRKVFYGGGAAAGLLLGGVGANALFSQPPLFQDNAATSPAQDTRVVRNFLNKNVIRLPIEINDSLRSQIQEIQLYVKEQPTAPWTLCEKVDSGRDAFIFNATKDGEYAFLMITIDRQGRGMPANLQSEPAGLVVVIDTQRPRVTLTNLGESSDGQLIHCEMSDANPDSARMRIQFQGGDKIFRSLLPVPGKANVYCIPAEAVCTGLIRVSADDLAGNRTEHEEQLNQMSAKAPVAAVQDKKIPEPTMLHPLPLNLQKPPAMTSNDPIQKVVPPRVMTDEPTPLSSTHEPPISQPAPRRPDGSDGPRFEPNLKHTSHSVPITRQLVNTTKLFLDYQIENAGQGSTVAVWVTKDHGKSWNKLAEDAQRKSPVEVNLPGEGVFGVSLVATTPRGAGPTPNSGDVPDAWIEVDTTKPHAEFSKFEVTHENGQASVAIHWNVKDQNLASNPVELHYSGSAQGPWVVIAKGLQANGHHVWTPSTQFGVQAHLRLIVRDAAGNEAIVATNEPVNFGRPRAVLKGITPAGR